MCRHPIRAIVAHEQDIAVNVRLNVAHFVDLLSLLVSVRDRHE